MACRSLDPGHEDVPPVREAPIRSKRAFGALELLKKELGQDPVTQKVMLLEVRGCRTPPLKVPQKVSAESLKAIRELPYIV